MNDGGATSSKAKFLAGYITFIKSYCLMVHISFLFNKGATHISNGWMKMGE